jgi:TetR/AcrR family transcriptional regulator
MAKRQSMDLGSSEPEAVVAPEPGPTRKRSPKSRTPSVAPAAKPPVSPKLRLLEAATMEFSERGFAGARIEAIARKAQMNKQLIYHYYGGKQKLYAAVLTDMVRRLQLGGGGGVGDGGTDQVARRSLDLSLEMLDVVGKPAGRQWIRLLMFEALETSGAIHLEAPRRRVYQRGVDAVARAQERGEIDPVFEADMLRLALFGLTLAPALLPQITKLVTGQNLKDCAFKIRWATMLREIYERLAPPSGGGA